MLGQQRSSPSYYSILGIGSNSSSEEIKRAYRKLAMQWHPDRWAKNPSLLCEAKSRFQQIQEAYSVLSDYRKRRLYDAGLYDPDEEEEEDEGFSDFMQEMLSLMAQERRKNKQYTMEELQGMLVNMAQEFQSPPWYCDSSTIHESSRPRNSTVSSDSRFSISGWGMYGMNSFCS